MSNDDVSLIATFAVANLDVLKKDGIRYYSGLEILLLYSTPQQIKQSSFLNRIEAESKNKEFVSKLAEFYIAKNDAYFAKKLIAQLEVLEKKKANKRSATLEENFSYPLKMEHLEYMLKIKVDKNSVNGNPLNFSKKQQTIHIPLAKKAGETTVVLSVKNSATPLALPSKPILLVSFLLILNGPYLMKWFTKLFPKRMNMR